MKWICLSLALFTAQIVNAQASDTNDTTKTHTLQEFTFNSGTARMKEQIASVQMGKVEIPVTVLAKVPTIGGEPDVMKALQLTPGVKRGAEGSIGSYVRGGGKDENLILMDGAPVYNAGHLLGFFSVFNTSALKDVQLYKSSFPAQFGGRLSSVMDITTKDGSMYKLKGNASLGLISSSMTVQGPIVKEKLSFIVSGRRTYADKVLGNIPYYFYDLNSKITYRPNQHHKLSFTMYRGDDVMDLVQHGKDSVKGDYTIQSGMKLGNDIASLKWSIRPEDERQQADLCIYYSGFRYKADGRMRDNYLSVSSNIRDAGFRGDWQLQYNDHHSFRTGMHYAYHAFNPGISQASGELVEQLKSGSRLIESHEMAAYVQDDITVSEALQVSAGMRLSAAAVPQKVYVHPEPRLGMRYLLNEHCSVKASYARMVQYTHLVSSSSMSLPTDLWYPVSNTVKPGISDQVSAGYYRAFPGAGISISSEVYYKWMKNLIEYKEGALLLMNDDYEKELLHGKGNSYGIELFVSKTTGKFTGWVGYSLSFATRQFDSLNKGEAYYARYDRRHDFSVVGMYSVDSRWSVGAVVQYATGSPFTGQQGQYAVPKPDYSGIDLLPIYTGRNALRLSSSFRIDLDVAYKFKLKKSIDGDVHFGVYNVLNRTQPYAVQRVYDASKKAYVYEQKGLFGTIPSVTLNLNF